MGNSSYKMEELVPVVSRLAQEYCGYEHSSVTYERAQALMEAVLYCIRETETADGFALAGGKAAPMDVYLAGRRLAADKFEQMQKLYGRVLEEFEDYGVECLRDTVVYGISAFVKHYDIRFAPQETLLTLDYPVLRSLQGMSGIDAVFSYVESIGHEQRFLKAFGADYVREVFLAFCEEYEYLPENICHIVLPNAAVCFWLNRPLAKTGISMAECRAAEALLTGKTTAETEADLEGFLEKLVRYRYGEDEKLLEYLKCAVSDLAVRMQANAKNRCLDKMLLVEKEA